MNATDDRPDTAAPPTAKQREASAAGALAILGVRVYPFDPLDIEARLRAVIAVLGDAGVIDPAAMESRVAEHRALILENLVAARSAVRTPVPS